MSTRKETVKICDVCQKRVSDDGEITFGGHVHSGWFKLHEQGGGTSLEALRKVRDWDVCGIKCLKRLVAEL